jgi:competence protein ComEC
VLVAVGLNAQGVADGEGSSGDWVWGGVCFAGVVALIAGVQWSQGGRRWLSVSAVCLLVAAVSFLSASTRMLRSPPMPVAPGLLTIEGWVAEPVRKLEARPGVRFRGDAGALSAFAIRVKRVESASGWEAAEGVMAVRVAGTSDVDPEARVGSMVRVTGVWTPIASPKNWGEGDPRLWANLEGRLGALRASDASLVLPAADSGDDALHRVWSRLRAWVRLRADAALAYAAPDQTEAGALVRALLLGETDRGIEGEAVRGQFARQGLAHALSISGFHVTLMATLALAAARMLGLWGGIHRWAVLGLVLFLAVLVPSESPMLRAVILTVVVHAGEASRRRFDRLTLLGWTAAGLILWRPVEVWSMGFQLSVGLTAVLFGVAPVFEERVLAPVLKGVVSRNRRGQWKWVPFARSLLRRAFRGGVRSVLVAVLCWLVSVPLVWLRAGTLSTLATPLTILVTPLLVVVLWVGYLALLLGMVVPSLGSLAAPVIRIPAEWAVRAVAWADSHPWSSVVLPPVPAWWAAAMTLALLVWASVPVGATVPRRWRMAIVAAVWIVAGMLPIWWAAHPNGLDRGVRLRIDMLSVESGSCYVIRTPRETLLWDCGGGWPIGKAGVQPGVVGPMRAVGVSRAPVAVVTHPDSDHYSGLTAIEGWIGLKRVLTCERFLENSNQAGSPEAEVAAALRGRGVAVEPVSADAQLQLDEGVTLTILHPRLGDRFGRDNDHSVVALIEVRGQGGTERRVLLTGDVQDEAIGILRGRYPEFETGIVDVMELPHHGSAREPSISWVGAIAPGLVLQSTDSSRANDARWEGVRNPASREAPAWLCTTTDGAASVEIGSDGGIRWETVRRKTDARAR